jgi:flavin reductase
MPSAELKRREFQAPVAPGVYRQLMRNLASGVVVITVAHKGQRHGMTATAVASVAADPATLLVAVYRGTRCHSLIAESGSFAVNVLAESQGSLGAHFASDIEDRFVGIGYHAGHAGLPLLQGAAASLECQVIEGCEVASHTVFIGRVIGGRQQAAPPLVYHHGAYHRLAALPD